MPFEWPAIEVVVTMTLLLSSLMLLQIPVLRFGASSFVTHRLFRGYVVLDRHPPEEGAGSRVSVAHGDHGCSTPRGR